MKYLYLLMIASTSMHLHAQETGRKIFFAGKPPLSQATTNTQAREMVACGTDTIRYPLQKETALPGTDSFFIDAMVGNARTASQAYTAGQSITIKGLQFWGRAYTVNLPSKNIPVEFALWLVDAQHMPVTQLATATTNVTHVNRYYTATFATPVTVTGNYAVTVRCVNNSDTLAVMTNNAGSPWHVQPYNESLAWRRFGSGAWVQSAGFFGQDLEYMVFPIVEYNFTTDFTTQGAAVAGSPQLFTNLSSSILQNRMYNLHVFNDHFNLFAYDSTFAWNYGEGPVQFSKDGYFIYTTAGSKTVQLTLRLKGYHRHCNESKSAGITIGASTGTTDTIRYPQHKELLLSSGPDSFFMDHMVGNVRTASQAYHPGQQITIKGVQFRGRAYSVTNMPKNIPVVVSVWSTDAMNMPVAELTSATFYITEQFGNYTALFLSPLSVNGNFAVTVRSLDNSDTLGVECNNAGSPWQAQAYNEGLAWRRFGSGAWVQVAGFFNQDVDYMIFPIVQYEVAPAFVYDGAAVTGVPETFANTSSSLFQNRMFNLHAFNRHFGLASADSTFTWRYGNSAPQVQQNGMHTFDNPGVYDVKLVAGMKGYFINQADSVIMSVTTTWPLPATLAYFTGRHEKIANQLQWQAVTEEQVNRYVIERSANGNDFVDIGAVHAKNMSNNRYDFTDATPPPTSYYRLRITDADGRYEHSRMVKIDRTAMELFTIQATKRGNTLQLNLHSTVTGKVSVQVTNAVGALIMQKNYHLLPGNNTYLLHEMQAQAAGVYYIKVSHGQVVKTVGVVK
jgi:hypothetical protein